MRRLKGDGETSLWPVKWDLNSTEDKGGGECNYEVVQSGKDERKNAQKRLLLEIETSDKT